MFKIECCRAEVLILAEMVKPERKIGDLQDKHGGLRIPEVTPTAQAHDVQQVIAALEEEWSVSPARERSIQ